MTLLEVLGAAFWFNNNISEAIEGKLDEPFLDDDDAHQDLYVRMIMVISGLARANLEEYGRLVMARGYCENRSLRTFEYAKGFTCQIFRSIKPGCWAWDGIYLRQNEDMFPRYSYGPRWHNRLTCSIDTAIHCAIVLDVGLMQVDQVTRQYYDALPKAAQLIRQIVKSDWAELRSDQRTAARDMLYAHFNDTEPGIYPLSGEWPLDKIIDRCFEGLPQLSWTSLRTTRCCDGKIRVGSAIPSRNNNLNTIDLEQTIQQQIQKIFDYDEVRIDARCCTREAKCNHKSQRLTLVLDRLPPTLMVHVPYISRRVSKKLEPFDDIDLTYFTTNGLQKISYSVVGCIFRPPRHFINTWKHDGKYFCYDGMKHNGKVFPIDNWFGGHSQAELMVLFYRKKD